MLEAKSPHTKRQIRDLTSRPTVSLTWNFGACRTSCPFAPLPAFFCAETAEEDRTFVVFLDVLRPLPVEVLCFAFCFASLCSVSYTHLTLPTIA